MAVYLISDVTVRDAEAFEAYRTRAALSIAAHGARYLVRGGAIDVLEGERHPTLLVIVEFPDRASAERWYASAEYGEALKFRDEGLSRSLVLVDGIDSTSLMLRRTRWPPIPSMRGAEPVVSFLVASGIKL